jgi:hypothetical protein
LTFRQLKRYGLREARLGRKRRGLYRWWRLKAHNQALRQQQDACALEHHRRRAWRALYALAARATERRRRKALKQRALASHTHWLYHLAMQRLRRVCRVRRASRQLTELASVEEERLRGHGHLVTWSRFARHRRLSEAYRTKAPTRGEVYHTRRCVRLAWRVWRAFFRRQKRGSEVIARVREYRQLRLCTQAMARVRQVTMVNDKYRAGDVQRRRRALRGGVRGWRAWLALLRAARRVRTRAQQRVEARIWRRWRSIAALRFVVLAEADRLGGISLGRRVLRSWSKGYRWRRRCGRVGMAVFQMISRRVAQRTWRRWRAYFLLARRARRLLNREIISRARSLVATAFLNWRRAVWQTQQAGWALARQESRRLRTSLVWLHTHARRRRLCARAAVVAQRLHKRHELRRHWRLYKRAWGVARFLARSQRRGRWGFRLLRVVVRAWSGAVQARRAEDELVLRRAQVLGTRPLAVRTACRLIQGPVVCKAWAKWTHYRLYRRHRAGMLAAATSLHDTIVCEQGLVRWAHRVRLMRFWKLCHLYMTSRRQTLSLRSWKRRARAMKRRRHLLSMCLLSWRRLAQVRAFRSWECLCVLGQQQIREAAKLALRVERRFKGEMLGHWRKGVAARKHGRHLQRRAEMWQAWGAFAVLGASAKRSKRRRASETLTNRRIIRLRRRQAVRRWLRCLRRRQRNALKLEHCQAHRDRRVATEGMRLWRHRVSALCRRRALSTAFRRGFFPWAARWAFWMRRRQQSRALTRVAVRHLTDRLLQRWHTRALTLAVERRCMANAVEAHRQHKGRDMVAALRAFRALARRGRHRREQMRRCRRHLAMVRWARFCRRRQYWRQRRLGVRAIARFHAQRASLRTWLAAWRVAHARLCRKSRRFLRRWRRFLVWNAANRRTMAVAHRFLRRRYLAAWRRNGRLLAVRRAARAAAVQRAVFWAWVRRVEAMRIAREKARVLAWQQRQRLMRLMLRGFRVGVRRARFERMQEDAAVADLSRWRALRSLRAWRRVLREHRQRRSDTVTRDITRASQAQRRALARWKASSAISRRHRMAGASVAEAYRLRLLRWGLTRSRTLHLSRVLRGRQARKLEGEMFGLWRRAFKGSRVEGRGLVLARQGRDRVLRACFRDWRLAHRAEAACRRVVQGRGLRRLRAQVCVRRRWRHLIAGRAEVRRQRVKTKMFQSWVAVARAWRSLRLDGLRRRRLGALCRRYGKRLLGEVWRRWRKWTEADRIVEAEGVRLRLAKALSMLVSAAGF